MSDATTPAADGGHDSEHSTDPTTDTIPVHPSAADRDPVEVRADVHLPSEVAAAIAYRFGIRVAQGADATERDVKDLALDYAAVRPRFLVEGTDMTLIEWLRQEAELSALDPND